MRLFSHQDDAAAAGRWLARRDRGLTPQEQASFDRWLAADPRHPEAFENLAGPFRALDRARALVSPSAAIDEDFLVRRPIVSRRLRFSVITGGLAAALACGIFLLREFTAQGQIPRADAPIARQESDRLVLPDGSVVELRPGAHVEVAFTEPERRVRLTAGEAYFTVAKNPARPFVVDAGGVAVRAVGTMFAVSRDSAKVEVVVAEGRVRVDDLVKGQSLLAHEPVSPLSADAEILAAGHRVVIPISGGIPTQALAVSISASELGGLLSWRNVWLEFNKKPLAEIAKQFNGFNIHQLKIADAATGAVLVTGTFRPDGEEAFIRLLESSFGVTANSDADGNYVLRKTE
jgi:transmembrane sensor